MDEYHSYNVEKTNPDTKREPIVWFQLYEGQKQEKLFSAVKSESDGRLWRRRNK